MELVISWQISIGASLRLDEIYGSASVSIRPRTPSGHDTCYAIARRRHAYSCWLLCTWRVQLDRRQNGAQRGPAVFWSSILGYKRGLNLEISNNLVKNT